MDLNAKIYIAGHRGLVGSAILRNRFPFFEAERPEYVFLAVMPTNLYGLNDNYDPMNSHVLPALIRRFHAAKMLMESSSSQSKSPLWKRGAGGF